MRQCECDLGAVSLKLIPLDFIQVERHRLKRWAADQAAESDGLDLG